MNITNSTPEDITEIFRLYKIASAYQKAIKTVIVWPNFERILVEKEVSEQRQFKLLINNEIACVWAVTFSDEQIWEKRNIDTAVYIHRIATNPNYRGQNFVGAIVTWAKEYAKVNNKRYVRLDTLGENTKLINHYNTAGFEFLGLFDLKNTDTLPTHYKEAPVCLFQIDLGA
ncbi:MAG: ribosomal protein S18 acetylase RimI-like enzyme [Maribacter sp.]|jgi:ribosomal protein S18 acetylase RimI-like enzyme